ncbi:D-galactose 1-dehydrogenase [Tahibacter aquaticus]|uniref:D-galactose 1-dehydrogenase n=1 Tax=Tahibacter aquaticus TaxID=520092 RepID=A0A4V6PYC0_9GAMM|nr:Gfo/Idh/MocA family oxidoreductase [Tahibacter aquaticus]TDR42039.1 D-galactose 1-dehydrogenase [Tahibacter aquaticus]
MNRIGLALAGVGKIARDQHLPSLAASDAFALVATIDPAAGVDGIPAYADLDAALDAHAQIQAVALCTPPAVRAPLARQALLRGCHVLLEKPPCVQPQELDDLRQLALRQGVSLFAAWHSRFAPAVDSVRAALRRQTVTRVQVSWKEDHRIWHPGQEWLWRDGGFGVLDPGINALSILTHILPAPLVFGDAELDCPLDSPMPAAARIGLRCAAAPVAMELDFLHAGAACWNIVIDTAQAQLVLSHGGARLSIDGQPCPVPQQGEYAALYTHFAALIRSGAHDVDAAPLALAWAALQQGQRRTLQMQVLVSVGGSSAPAVLDLEQA